MKPPTLQIQHAAAATIIVVVILLSRLPSSYSQQPQPLLLVPTFHPTYPFDFDNGNGNGEVMVGDNIVDRTLPPTINTGSLTGRGQPSATPTYKPSFSPTTQDFGNVQVEVPGIEEETVRPPGETDMPTYYPTPSSRESMPGGGGVVQSNSATATMATATTTTTSSSCWRYYHGITYHRLVQAANIGYYLLLGWYYFQ